tara:strand:+ start:797 stop:1285 length:489 start_codon:yes stop_codon:yes gene_type:complete
MTKITLETTVNIDFTKWVDQAKRFAKITDKVKSNNLALDELTSGKASIEIVYKEPLNNGFNGEITYFQHYTKEIQEQQYDDLFNPIGEPITKTVDAKHKVIEYSQFIDKATIEYLIDQTLLLIPESVTGYFAREQKAIEIICLKNAQDFYTFNLANDEIVVA